MMYKYSKLYWFFRKFEWMQVYFSPFKFFLPKLYIGKVAIPTPIFYPRKWVSATPKRALEATLKHIKEIKDFNERNPNYKKTVKSFSEVYDAKMKSRYTVPLKIGFSFCGLGFKTKWTNTDYRFEYNPVWSFVYFGYQIALIFRPEHLDCYWTCWLFYNFETKGTVRERLEQARREFPCTWTNHSSEGEKKIDYYNLIIKNKWT